ncbi:methyl-accepting chemotaxis protein [Salinicola sp. DM10]|uniref:methyl-accepting chemotaxis protein n=1 Tax=Salinicola sp. DM10 TaxID=2815721 RepID=UPI001E53306A|nr:methyl-accepting chemotaxis protein [Salinicola sp. DM10]MCE3026627.1 methyl-accepting chemotaxis protein [Salinicola sp. DM10]
MSVIGRSVKARLVVALGVLIALLIAIGVQGVISNSQTQESMRSIVERNVQSMIELSTLRATISDNRTIFAVSRRQELSAEQHRDVEANRERGMAAWNRYYPKLISNDEQRQQAENFIQALKHQQNLMGGGNPSESEIRQSYANLYAPIAALYDASRKETLTRYQQSLDNYQTGRTIIIAAILVALLIAIAIGWWLARGILRPLKEATDFSTALAEGNLGVRLDARYRDEFGRMLDAMAAMRDKLTGVIREVAQNARNVESISGELAASNGNLSQRTQEQAASLQETASALEQITNTVSQNADNAGQADTLASEVSTQAKQGGEVVDEAIGAMREIDASSKEISNIIGMIDEIAFQTNLLALNASVEAARAGEQGRGFAVVAQEVRQLASRSADAAGEIKQLVSESAQRVARGSELVNRSGETLAQIVTNVEKVTDLVSEIAVASREQSTGIQQINLAVGEMDSVTQQNATLVEESTTVTSHLQSQAEQLAQEISFFRGYDDGSRKAAQRAIGSATAALSAPQPQAKPATRQVSRQSSRQASAEVEEWSSF